MESKEVKAYNDWMLVLQHIWQHSKQKEKTSPFRPRKVKVNIRREPLNNILPPKDKRRVMKIEVERAMKMLELQSNKANNLPSENPPNIFDMLKFVFQFQNDNVENQKEHLILLLANSLSKLPPNYKENEKEIKKEVSNKILKNYENWCSYIGKQRVYKDDEKLYYTALYLCIWGEAANVRLLPECICYLFHTLSEQLEKEIKKPALSDIGAESCQNSGFLDKYIVPIYEALEKQAVRHGKAHSKWGNYDDFNEFFWSKSCFKLLENGHHENLKLSLLFSNAKRKVSFIEHRTFLHLYHSFARLWILLTLMLQALTIIAFTMNFNRNTLKYLLSLGPTYFAMKFIESLCDIRMMMGFYVLLQHHDAARIVTLLCFYGGCTGGIAYLYWKTCLETTTTNFYLMLWVLGAYAVIKVILSLFQRLSSTNTNRLAVFMKWIHRGNLYVGDGLYESFQDYIKYSLFWILLLAFKFSFSFYFQILPLAKASKAIYSFAEKDAYQWQDIISERHHNALALLFLWAPVVLIYLLDIEIWYIVLSSIIGGFSGYCDGLGKILSLDMLRCHFSLFHKKFVQKLIYAKQSDSAKKQTYETCKFPEFWNKIIEHMREEDYLTNREKEFLTMPAVGSSAEWPLFLLAGKVSLLLKDGNAAWVNIKRDPFMFSAVREVCYSILTLAECIEPNHMLFKGISEEVEIKLNDPKTFSFEDLKSILQKVKGILRDLDNTFSANQFGHNLQDLIKLMCGDTHKKSIPLFEVEREDLLTVLCENDFFRRLKHLLNSKESDAFIPRNREAQRRLQFFANSVFMKMPQTPSVEDMKSFSVLTPYDREAVIYSLENLQQENEDGITILFYLQKIFPDEWDNLLERLDTTEKEITALLKEDLENGNATEEDSNKKALNVRLWASYRGQTLARTVRGMMYYRMALELQAFTEATDVNEKQEIAVHKKQEIAEQLADFKFTYVLSCQNYWEQKESPYMEEQAKARDIQYLLKTYSHKGLRVACIEENIQGSKKKLYYSNLIKMSEGEEKVVYSIKLPGNPMIGEGKPENQNHAIIFTRGDALQTIDMNQDNYFEEALKMRNLLEEFNGNHGLNDVTILGVREHIFTGSVSSLASFMSNQEASFVTLGKRFLARPLKVRMHYGHPDIFDRLFHLTRGGVSKASKTININEDVFAGFNSTLRKGNITHHEYIQVGKGRDVGLNQISLSEAKISGGNGEQLLSRDVYRLGQWFDFFRMLSFYVTSLGYYACTLMTVVVVYIFLYGKAYLALSGLGKALSSHADIDDSRALQTALDAQFLIQIGILTAVPILAFFILEQGLVQAIIHFIVMQLQLCSVFFTFSLGTRAHYFGRTVLQGGAKYMHTGRDFMVKHINFTENYRLYSRSHFARAFEIIMLLLVIKAYGYHNSTTSYSLFSLFVWFLAISWLFAPFIFNPSGFEWQKTVEDIDDCRKWLFYERDIGIGEKNSWKKWWDKEQEHDTSIAESIVKTLLSLRFFLVQYGLVYHLHIIQTPKLEHAYPLVYAYSWLVFLGVILIFLAFSYGPKISIHYQMLLRLIQGTLFIVLTIILGLCLAFKIFSLSDLCVSALAFIPTGWGLLVIAKAWKPLMKKLHLWKGVRSIAWYYDMAMCMLILLPITILSWFPFVSTFQTRLLFNQAFSRGLEISLILSGNRPDKSEKALAYKDN
ncbi:hypothetical protein KP509_03G007700 [Ceratopteris richardii]|uniref:1,3-beta-glucan synthase n=1 Tax=Ceratopteris richardii TaxID=49495 RepID=A0A8T2UZW4_CERRI|nr:hypothetical protein KP509_03G007700 [Ceratopteris richardii]KAH7440722.1 hypothetical protein KP509_03G007700 [Ceratopteris richardii]